MSVLRWCAPRPELSLTPVKWDSNGAISSVLCLLVKSTKLSIYPNLRMLNHTICCCTSWKDSVDGMCFVDVSAAFYLLSCKVFFVCAQTLAAFDSICVCFGIFFCSLLVPQFNQLNPLAWHMTGWRQADDAMNTLTADVTAAADDDWVRSRALKHGRVTCFISDWFGRFWAPCPVRCPFSQNHKVPLNFRHKFQVATQMKETTFHLDSGRGHSMTLWQHML